MGELLLAEGCNIVFEKVVKPKPNRLLRNYLSSSTFNQMHGTIMSMVRSQENKGTHCCRHFGGDTMPAMVLNNVSAAVKMK